MANARQTGTKNTKKPTSGKGSRTSAAAGKNTSKKKTGKKKTADKFSFPILDEVLTWISLALCVILMLSNFGLGGIVGNAISGFLFGVFGLTAYVLPVILFIMISFLISNRKNMLAWMKAAAVFLLIICFGGMLELVMNHYEENRAMVDYYTLSASEKSGGGVFGGVMIKLLCPAFGIWGAYVVMAVLILICLVLVTERSLFAGVRNRGKKVYENAREGAQLRKERAAIREERLRLMREESLNRKREEMKAEKESLKMLSRKQKERVKKGSLNDSLDIREIPLQNVHEVIPAVPKEKAVPQNPPKKTDDGEPELKFLDFTIQGMGERREEPENGGIQLPFTDGSLSMEERKKRRRELYTIHEKRPGMFEEQLRRAGEIASGVAMPASADQEPFYEREGSGEDAYIEEEEVLESLSRPLFSEENFEKENFVEEPVQESEEFTEEERIDVSEDGRIEAAADTERPLSPKREKNPRSSKEEQQEAKEHVAAEIAETAKIVKPEYVFPPLSLLNKPKGGKSGDSDKELRETAMKLQKTLHDFGVGVRITNVSCGPAVTRYELTPEQGVKVSRIVNLTDDIKLNLAAADIRIEAPIPGKAAVGIEVPNKTNSTVLLRELLESKEFREHPSNLAFAAGKDIGGNVVVTDIAKMPHLLIAGSTGSGKSVCINTIIMSILYKAKPEDVKLIMVDPKVVELSVYNGIPHLLIPVVTDPKKASGALNWAVAEMDARYQKFAEVNVRDLKGYNQKVEMMAGKGVPEEEIPEKMPQIVIIVDELADLMMVAPGEVEEAICRLAQLARAAGIHLIIATQRPSVNVITGLIKANMPSRIAFAVSSGVDSRTIIDMNGAEKLLGKGDMLFYPQGYQKPARVQGAFVSDSEVSKVVEFLHEKNMTGQYSEEIEEKITQTQKSMAEGGGSQTVDDYFVEAGKFIIEKDKASIGMLQRMFKIGFNRAARIMDQLADAGVVGPEEGTKPRKVLMSMEQFEEYVSDYV